MKFIRLFVFALFFAPFASMAATNEFTMAAQLLAAAKAADVQQVQSLVNSGANVNFVDSTGVSIVCTALMNNDTRAAQILQMYGADASKCDRQIKQYNNRNKQKGSGGLFSGLSSAQTISLAAAGAAVVVGGLLLLTDVFDPGNENENSSGGDRPNNNPGTDTGGAVSAYLTVPYSPAYLGTDGKINTSSTVYYDNLALWNPSAGGVRELDFNYFRPTVQPTNNYLVDGITVPLQNYLLMMHGYSAFANEYMGQFIFRDTASRNPVLVGNDTGGGNPVAVSLVTDNGISPTGSAGRGDGITYAASASPEAVTYLVDKYLNYANPTTDGTLGAEHASFDFSGSGTALNLFASAYDSALGKIVGGWAAGGRSYGDLFGFVPNGRLGIFRTGGGQEWINIADPIAGGSVGTLTDGAGGTSGVIEAGDTITLNGVTYDLSLAVTGTGVVNPTIEINGTTYRVPEKSTLIKGVCSGEDCADVSDIAIYVGTDGYYYVNTLGGDTIDAVYMVNSGNIYAQKELQDADFKNFEVLYRARSVSNVLANVSVLDASRNTGYVTVRDMPALVALNDNSGIETFVNQINLSYDRNAADLTGQGAYANMMFNSYSTGNPILVMPAGEFEYGSGAGKSLSALDATFENYAPALYDDNLNHMFMTVVAVQHSPNKGTDSADSIGEYGDGTGTSFGPLYLSFWTGTKGTSEITDDIVYSSRKCGVTGVGVNGIDPWCFAAAGPTTEMATASAAGAVAALKGAFDYMSNPQIFMLMALTADGYLLGTDAAGNAFTPETLAGYLQSMYSLPPEYYASSLTPAQYLDAFAEVYGYGMINLERAMTPGRSIYFYDGNRIVSANGNAYWRAATDTVFRPSSVLNLRGATIRAPFFDVLESADGKMALPRVWENSFAVGATNRRALYMGDVLGDFKTVRGDAPVRRIGNIDFSMSLSNRGYDDGLGGLDNLRLGYTDGAWNFGASYQRYLTDGASRFDGRANPVLGLATNAIVSDIEYNMGNWSFGARAFSGAITDEGLLENDPTISAQYMPAKLGLMQGGQSHVAWSGDAFDITAVIGFAHENNTLLGAYTDGLLNLGAGDTAYVDLVAKYDVADKFNLMARATFARTHSDVAGDFVLGMSDIYSNAFALGADIGAFEFSVAMPLAITDGALQYAHAEYDVVETSDNNYQLNVIDTRVADLALDADMREVRFSGAYRHKFGEFTDGAFGFIYRVNPNHTDEFGNESIFMLKLNHRLGI